MDLKKSVTQGIVSNTYLSIPNINGTPIKSPKIGKTDIAIRYFLAITRRYSLS